MKYKDEHIPAVAVNLSTLPTVKPGVTTLFNIIFHKHFKSLTPKFLFLFVF